MPAYVSGHGLPASNAYGPAHRPALDLAETDGTITAARHGGNQREAEGPGARTAASPFRPGECAPPKRKARCGSRN